LIEVPENTSGMRYALDFFEQGGLPFVKSIMRHKVESGGGNREPVDPDTPAAFLRVCTIFN